jgi:thiamine-phosphate pyrophosphorylase
LGADLIGFGPVFPTASKERPDDVVGLPGLRAVCAAVGLPVVAIGGVALDNAAAVTACGPAMAAAISAVCGAEDPERAASHLHRTLRDSAG